MLHNASCPRNSRLSTKFSGGKPRKKQRWIMAPSLLFDRYSLYAFRGHRSARFLYFMRVFAYFLLHRVRARDSFCDCYLGFRPPPYQFRVFQRKRGRRSLGQRLVEIRPRPPVSNDTWESSPLFLSSDRDASYKEAASCFDPRRVSHHLDAV